MKNRAKSGRTDIDVTCQNNLIVALKRIHVQAESEISKSSFVYSFRCSYLTQKAEARGSTSSIAIAAAAAILSLNFIGAFESKRGDQKDLC
eukprot:21083-Heterococcus_DN1.PRE.2